MKKLFAAVLALLFAATALGQSYPSPTYNNITSQGTASLNNATVSGAFAATGTFTATGKVGLTNLAAQAANTVVGNATSSSATPTAITVTGCNGAAQALQWTNGFGFQCNSGIATSGANANITSLSGLTTPLSTAQGGTGTTSTTGTGSVVFSASPTLTGTATVANLTATGTLTGFTGRLLNVQRFTSSGTYTPTTGTASIIVEVLGGGGGGGGAGATAAGQVAPAAGGASGSYSVSRITSGFSGATVTVGSAGAGGAAGANAGSAGGTSSFGAFVTAPGGSGGQPGTAIAPPIAYWSANGAAQASGGTLINSQGQPGTFGIAMSTGDTLSGSGGPSVFGGGGNGITTTGAGGAAMTAGAGGGGACSTNGGAAQAGGSGGAGVVIVYEYSQ
ncbi:hypothetical protein [Burkholderia multivorans]|uniref:glycine-rich domain-containing protein n=1 Tax=Burkholderia multivorans TaxID=87883 RepID=UPI0011B26ED4|nr:hypothetical protein [Burkholderia multivorans]